MRIYIAAPYPMRDMAIAVMKVLEGDGHVVTSSWLKENDVLTDEFARKDLSEVAAADALLALNPPGWGDKGTGGRHVELGYALALGKKVYLLGERTNIFHHLEAVVQIETFKGAFDA